MAKEKEINEMEIMMGRYLDWISVRGYAALTVKGRGYDLRYFREWCDDRGVNSPREVSRAVLDRYQSHLHNVPNKTKENKKLSSRTQHLRLSALKHFFHWLSRYNHILSNPAVDLVLPKVGQRLPREVLTIKEVETVLNSVNLDGPLGLRDRAILEVLYSTGIRRMELCNLKKQDINLDEGFVLIRDGKNKKDRVVPIGERAMAWIDKYVWDLRGQLASDPDIGILFLTKDGKPLRPKHLTVITRKYVKLSGLGKNGSCHMFRHTMATLMLEGGADIRYIQEILGHAHLDTTQVYTRVSTKKLKEVHSATHPGARLMPYKSRRAKRDGDLD